MFTRLATNIAKSTNKVITSTQAQKRKLTIHGFQNYGDAKKHLRGERIQAYGIGVFMAIVAPLMFFYGENGHFSIHYVWEEDNKPIALAATPGTVRFPYTCGHCTPFDPICFQKCRELEKEKRTAYEKIMSEKQ